MSDMYSPVFQANALTSAAASASLVENNLVALDSTPNPEFINDYDNWSDSDLSDDREDDEMEDGTPDPVSPYQTSTPATSPSPVIALGSASKFRAEMQASPAFFPAGRGPPFEVHAMGRIVSIRNAAYKTYVELPFSGAYQLNKSLASERSCYTSTPATSLSLPCTATPRIPIIFRANSTPPLDRSIT